MRRALLCLTLVVAGIPAPSAAQLQLGGDASNFGTVTLSPGFAPDPRSVSVLSGGTLDVPSMGLGSGCVGYATAEPDYIVHLTAESDRLRFYVEGDGDTGLVINGPAGGWSCSDDSYDTVSPTVTLDHASPGQYDIWVTSYSSGENITGTLYVTELDNHPGASGSNGSDAELAIGGSTANFGSVSLSTGFSPDPYSVSVISGGTLDVGSMDLADDCVGYATEDPDLILNFTGNGNMLRFYVEGDGDTGLVINGPGGSWTCNDDSYDGMNPTVTIPQAGSGQYDVWVTSYESGENVNGTLHVTELDDNRPGTGGSSDGSVALSIGGSTANYGVVDLTTGFAPDPYSVSVISGGTLDVGAMDLAGECVGYATEQPDLILNFTGGGNMLRFYVEGDGDTGLVVNLPDGGWVCSDDSYDGLNPTITLSGADTGQYDIWVTSYDSGESISGTLRVTERESQHPEG
jgi:hypothetical protein